MENDCIFCKIIDNQIPSICIYEDDDFKVILDRFPSALGHTLIIPKKHYDNIFDLDEKLAEKLFPLVKEIASKINNKLKPDGINILQNNGETAGQSVNHFHVHIIPRLKEDTINIKWDNMNIEIGDLDKIKTKIAD